jgi:hypothetical protein
VLKFEKKIRRQKVNNMDGISIKFIYTNVFDIWCNPKVKLLKRSYNIASNA